MVKVKRESKLLLALSDRERGMVEALSEAFGLCLSDVIRQAIREEYLRRLEAVNRGSM